MQSSRELRIYKILLINITLIKESVKLENTKAKVKARKWSHPKWNKSKLDLDFRSIIKVKETRLSLIIVAILTMIGLGGLAYVKANSDDKAVEPITTVLEIPSVPVNTVSGTGN